MKYTTQQQTMKWSGSLGAKVRKLLGCWCKTILFKSWGLFLLILPCVCAFVCMCVCVRESRYGMFLLMLRVVFVDFAMCVHLYVCVCVCVRESRHGIFPPIGGFPPIERPHRSFLRSVQIRWETYRVYLTCERFSNSNFPSLPRASISFLHSTFSNGVNLFCFGHQQSVHVVWLWLTETTTKGSDPASLASQPFRDSMRIGGHFVIVSAVLRKLANWWQPCWKRRLDPKGCPPPGRNSLPFVLYLQKARKHLCRKSTHLWKTNGSSGDG